MVKKNSIKLFGDDKIRTVWDEDQEKWYFSIVDVVAVLTDSADANAYWRKLKQRLKQEGNETVTNCHGLKMLAADGKMRMTDVADTGQLLRIIQSVPSHKAEPFKQWLARVGAGKSCRPFQPSGSSKNRHPLPAWKIKRTNWNRSQQ